MVIKYQIQTRKVEERVRLVEKGNCAYGVIMKHKNYWWTYASVYVDINNSERHNTLKQHLLYVDLMMKSRIGIAVRGQYIVMPVFST